MTERKNYKKTLAACYLGFITQAIAANFAPLLFLTFKDAYGIGLEKIAMIPFVFYLTQLLTDFAATKFVDKIGYRTCTVFSQALSAAGLVLMAVLPDVLSNPFAGILLSVVLYAVGSGLIEVLGSPIVEACPFENKGGMMSLLHSFYCWGCVAVILLTTAAFTLFGRDCWPYVACCWALLPAVNAVAFTRVPIRRTVEREEQLPLGSLLKNGLFWFLALLMACAGASELAMSQWASAFAEKALHMSKTVGDLAGPCFFAVLMGTARVIHAKLTGRVQLERYMALCALLCIASYPMAALMPHPVWDLLGCGLTGFAVGVMWPGTFSIAAARLPKGGTALFALLALFGDLGCSAGPTVVGFVSGAAGDNLKAGLLVATVFPLVILLGVTGLRHGARRNLSSC